MSTIPLRTVMQLSTSGCTDEAHKNTAERSIVGVYSPGRAQESTHGP